MSNNEVEVLNLFNNDQTKRLTRAEIRKAINKKDPSGIIRDLLYFEYLVENGDKTLSRTNKHYDDKNRKTECKPENYEFVLNKIFTGSHLEFNLGHEIINFIKDEDGQRYVYLNPLGKRSERAAKKTKYVFHIIESSINDENGIYELVAVSKIDRNANVNYKNGSPTVLNECPIFEGHNFYDIFYCGSEDSDKAYYYTYKASKLYRPKDNLRIILKIARNAATITRGNDKIVIELMCNPQHSICYADTSGRKTYRSKPNKNNDKSILESLILNGDVVESDETIDISAIEDEQCFSIISGRAQLEVSTSNQIAYFLRRDEKLIYSFLHDFLGVQDVYKGEKFEIVREKENNIDLLFKSDKHVIVVENKIDSKINDRSKTPNKNGKYDSQLSKYYDYIEKKYSIVETREYFVLAPEYNDISEQKLKGIYEKGDKYTLKTYNQLFQILKHLTYSPLDLEPTDEQKFLFSQFKKSVEYLTWSRGKQRERTAYIRLKQRIAELNKKEA